MTDKELKIQLALGALKWWELSSAQILKIKNVGLICLIHKLVHKDLATQVVGNKNIVDMVKIYMAIDAQYEKTLSKKQPAGKKSAQQ